MRLPPNLDELHSSQRTVASTERLRTEIAKATAEFLARGGKIKYCQVGQSTTTDKMNWNGSVFGGVAQDD